MNYLGCEMNYLDRRKLVEPYEQRLKEAKFLSGFWCAVSLILAILHMVQFWLAS